MERSLLHRMRRPWHKAYVAVCLVNAACGRSDAPGAEASASAARAAQSAALPSTRVQLVAHDPCAWLPRDSVEQILGPLAADPVRIVGAERADPAPDGNGCLYQPRVALGGEPYALAVEVIVDGGLTLETGLGAQLPRLGEAQMAKTSPGEAASEGGLDWAGGVSGIYGARQGHISIMMGDQAPWLGRARLDSLAKRLVDGIPDLPFTQMKGDPDVAAAGHDPCALVTPSEATTVLGALVVSPYRSRESSILARGDGASCTYYLGKHRALILTPTWSDGVASFKMLAGATQFVGRVLSNQTAADTLDGPWDEASSGTDGTFYFVKGDRMIAVQYGMSGAGAGAAVKLARLAAGRL